MQCEYCGQSIRYDEERSLPAWVHSGTSERPCLERPGRNAWPHYDPTRRDRGPRSPWGVEGVFWQAEVPGGGHAFGHAPDQETARRVIGHLRSGRSACPGCGGAGATCCVRAYVGVAGAGSMALPRRCETCEGRGWLPGTEPPA